MAVASLAAVTAFAAALMTLTSVTAACWRCIQHITRVILTPSTAACVDTVTRAVFVKLHWLERDLGFDELFNITHQTLIVARHKTDGNARCPRAPRATNPVHIVFSVERNVKVKHRWHIFDVQTTRGHIGAHQQIHFAAFEGIKRLQTFVLALVTMQGTGAQTITLE